MVRVCLYMLYILSVEWTLYLRQITQDISVLFQLDIPFVVVLLPASSFHIALLYLKYLKTTHFFYKVDIIIWNRIIVSHHIYSIDCLDDWRCAIQFFELDWYCSISQTRYSYSIFILEYSAVFVMINIWEEETVQTNKLDSNMKIKHLKLDAEHFKLTFSPSSLKAKITKRFKDIISN